MRIFGILLIASACFAGCMSVVLVNESTDTEADQDQDADLDSDRQLDIEGE